MKEVIPLRTDLDVLRARERGRDLARSVGFAGSDLTLIATAISEVSRNVITYAGRGQLEVQTLHGDPQPGIQIISRDKGPGIANVELALMDGYSTSLSFGMGLPGCRRIMDEFEIESAVGEGTTVTMRKWLRR